LRPTQARDPKYPDAGYDPIASFEAPFQGEFYTNGNVITTQTLSARNHVVAGLDVKAFGNATIDNDAQIGRNLTVDKNLTVRGDLTVMGETSRIETTMYVTSAVNITNVGSGPALRVEQAGFFPIAHFIDSNGEDIVIDDNGKLGMGTDTPNADLHLVRDTPNASEIRLQSTNELGSTLINMVGLSPNTEGCYVQYENYNGLVTLKNKNGSPLGPAFSIETQSAQAVVITPQGKVAIGPLSNPPEALTVVGNISATNQIFGSTIKAGAIISDSFVSDSVSTKRLSAQVVSGFVVWSTGTATARGTTVLPISSNDVELTTTANVTVSSFANGIKGITYTLTNISTKVITISSSPFIYVRTGNAWRSNTFSLSTAFIQLAPYHSCSLRASTGGVVSVW
jgi:hypothetical protein